MAYTISFDISNFERDFAIYLGFDPTIWCKDAMRAKLEKIADKLIEEKTKYRAAALTQQEKVDIINQIIGGS